jgi:diguanylate cyclase (GGDEF)-like protein
MITGLWRRCNPAAWEFWRLPGRLRNYIVGVHVVALAALGLALADTRWHARDLAVLAALVACGTVTIEVTRRVKVVYGTVSHDMQAVWFIAAAALCPPSFAMLLPLMLVPYRVARMSAGVTYRRVFGGPACALAYGGAGALFSLFAHALDGTSGRSGSHVIGWLAVLAACGAFGLAVNNALIVAAIKLSDPAASIRKHAFDREGAVTDLCQLSLAVLIALPAAFSPFLLVGALPVVIVMRRFMMHAQLVTAARIDSKTGLLNAATWQHEAGVEVSRAARIGSPLAIMIADIDHFKAVNDQHGHVAGDTVLALVAAAMAALLRDYDLLGRFGGEEFIVCLPHTGPEQAFQIAERLRGKIAQLSSGPIQVTISVGVASLESSRYSLDELILAADAALYRAKADGRNCVRITRDASAPRKAS